MLSQYALYRGGTQIERYASVLGAPAPPPRELFFGYHFVYGMATFFLRGGLYGTTRAGRGRPPPYLCPVHEGYEPAAWSSTCTTAGGAGACGFSKPKGSSAVQTTSDGLCSEACSAWLAQNLHYLNRVMISPGQSGRHGGTGNLQYSRT